MNSNAQNIKNYEVDWKSVENNIQKGLPASALEVVKKIYAKAKTEKQNAQVVKSLIYITQLQTENREENETKSIAEIEKEIVTSKEPATSLLKSYLAGLYLQYYNQNRYKLYNRTNTNDFKKTDIATWTTDDFHKKISDLYLASIANEKLLQQTSLPPYDALITKGNVRYLRPTLYDLLAHRALEYFQNNERDVNKPAYAFEISQAEAFTPAAEFINEKFVTKDSLSLQHKALLIYQQLLGMHLNDEKPDALIDVDIARIQFVHENSVHPQKDELYYDALQQITKKYGNIPAVAQAWYLLAQWHQERGNSYDANKDASIRYELLKAKEILDKILNSKTQSEGWTNAYNLRQQIEQPEMSFEIEKVNIPDIPFRMLVAFKNIDKIYLRIIPATESLKNAIQDENGSNYWGLLTAAKPIKSWEQALLANTDLQKHYTEIKIDALATGEYFIVASAKNDFGRNKNILATRLTYVSNISFVNNNSDYFVLNRDNGQPLNNAKIQVWKREYNYQTSKYTKAKYANFASDKNGYFRFAKQNEKNRSYGNYLFEISHGNERLFMDDEISNYYYYNDYKDNEKNITTNIFLFTDRSLYRPGQTVYFKGIAINKQNDGKKADILSDYKTTVMLLDANQQKIDSLSVVTNEYGSFSGNFKLPENGLNGMFTIVTKNQTGSAGFRMEEYKRPKFFVDFDKQKGSYKINDDIKVIGFAKAYAGNNIDGATVKYRVVREARFPYPWLFWRGWWPRTESQEIMHGETQTNAEGKFNIIFKAIPDLKVDKKNEPVFDYKIYADITDISGEVRSGEQVVSVGYKSLLLNVNVEQRLLVDSLNKLSIRTENMAGEFEKATVKVTISKLKTEQRLLRNRYWQKPDEYVMTKEEYIKNFPNDIYDNENEPKSWSKESTILEQVGSTDSTGIFKLNKISLSPGYYVIETTAKDKDGNEIKDMHYVEAYSEKQKTAAYPQYLYTKAPLSIEPGEKTTISIGSSANDIFLVQGTSKPDTKYSFLNLNQEVKNFDFGATEADRGGYGVSYLFVKNNRVYQSVNTIMVPWTNKDLQVEYNTFRDKTQPGAEEKWTVKISGYKKEKVSAEMIASMYDASLDQFYPHQWNKPSLWYNFYNNVQWNGTNNFGTAGANVENTNNFEYRSFEKNYDYIFGNNMPLLERGLYGKASGVVVLSDLDDKENIIIRGAAPVESKSSKTKMVGFAAPKVVKGEEVAVADTASGDVANTQQSAQTQIRKNFNETAFFFPDLKTDKDGSISFSFTMPEALTKWKFQALAHSKDLAFGYSTKELITQKELMVQPNAPRFLREGDKMEFSSKVVNLSAKELNGVATLQLFDAATNEPVDGIFKNASAQQNFSIAPGQSFAAKFPIEIPYKFNKALTWRIVAKANSLSDGEENMLPVLTNRMLVTETMPLNLRGNTIKNFRFEKLLSSAASISLHHQSLTVEYTSNPAWYAVQALPYMMEYPYDCAEQTWNRYYANALASLIANSSPKIKQVFEKWKTQDTAALLSNLQKNQELKSVLLEETPWVLEAKTEEQQKKNIALLFDLMRMSSELSKAYEKLRQMQSSNGGFVWFKGGPDDRYITQYIVTGIGHLKRLKASTGQQDANLNSIVQAAMPYLDTKIKEEYDNLLRYKTDLNKYTPSYYIVQYLYMRSFFSQIKILPAAQKAVDYFTDRSKKTWVQQNKYMQAMIALATHRNNDAATPKAILKSLKETSVSNEELGMYYKDAARSWWWYEAPIERQSLIIEAFEEVGKDSKTADDLRTWLLKNKQTNRWESTKATAEACYALLLRGTEWLSVTPDVSIELGGYKISSNEEKQEAGTGYLKKIIPAESIKPAMGNISVSVSTSAKTNNLPTWGAVYWQYFEDIDKITFAETPLKLNKKLFIETNSDNGPVLTPVSDGNSIKVGDKIKVRIELRVDRDMEYIHMKDMRATGFEPTNVLSTYKWQGGLGYYETTKDASTNFFFGYLPKGTYVFEYSMFATIGGNFSNGITTIQSMYAPEFTSHSEGIRVTVKP